MCFSYTLLCMIFLANPGGSAHFQHYCLMNIVLMRQFLFEYQSSVFSINLFATITFLLS